jgi:hypothetical protein
MKPHLKKLIENRIADVKATPDWFKYSFPEQRAFIEDESRLKAAQCTRRAGKSYGAGLYLCKEAYENPNVTCLYLALTRDSAERILWRDILKDINWRFGLKAKFHESRLIMQFPNGSTIHLLGADAKKDDMDKLLGQKFKLVLIDEASKYHIDVHKLIFDVLKPAVADHLGTIAMIGTASDFTASYFARVTQGKEAGWAYHRWSALNNPYMTKQFAEEIENHRINNPNVDDEAWFRQNYLGEWTVNEKNRIYLYPRGIQAPALPKKGEFNYNLGITLSYSGHWAASVMAYSSDHREAYVVESVRHPLTDLNQVIEEVVRLHEVYQFGAIVCADVSSKLTDELRSRYPISIQDVKEFPDKSTLIRLFTTELSQKNIKVLPNNADLIEEWDTIILDHRVVTNSSSKNAQIREHPLCPNHISTATLYAWYKCYNYNFSPEVIREDPNDEFWEKIEDRIENPIRDDFEDFYG